MPPLTPDQAAMLSYGPTPGASQYPAQFSYSPGSNPGTAFGAGSVAALGAAPAMYGTGLLAAGTAGMLGYNPWYVRMLNSRFADPIGHAVMSPFGAAASAAPGARMAAFGTAARAGLPFLAGGMAVAGAASFGAQQFVQGAADLNTARSSLSDQQFANAAAFSGRGFSTGQTNRILGVMREIDRADPLATLSEINTLLKKFSTSSAAMGIQDVSEFGRRFKQMTASVKRVAQVMGSSLEEAGNVLTSLRDQAGLYTGRDVMASVRRIGVARGYGLSQEEALGVMASGAATTQGAGLGRRAGALQMSALTNRVFAATGAGVVSSDRLMDVTGATDARQAAISAGGMVLGAQMSFLRGNTGTGLLSALGKQNSAGEYTGEIDQDALGRVLSGEIGLEDLAGMGAERMQAGGQKGRLSFAAKQSTLASSLLEADGGVPAVSRLIRTSAERRAGRDENAIRLLYQQLLGLNEQQANLYADLMTSWEESGRRMEQDARAEAESARRRFAESQYSFSGKAARLKGGLADMLNATGLPDLGSQALAGASSMYNSVRDRLLLGIETRPGSGAATEVGIAQGLQRAGAGGSVGVSAGALATSLAFETAGAFGGTAELDRALGGVSTEGLDQVAQAAREGWSGMRRDVADIKYGAFMNRVGQALGRALTLQEKIYVANKVFPNGVGNDIIRAFETSGIAGKNAFFGATSPLAAASAGFDDTGGRISGGQAAPLLSAIDSGRVRDLSGSLESFLEAGIPEDAAATQLADELTRMNISATPEDVLAVARSQKQLGSEFGAKTKGYLGALEAQARARTAEGLTGRLSGVKNRDASARLADYAMALAQGTGMDQAFGGVLAMDASALEGAPGSDVLRQYGGLYRSFNNKSSVSRGDLERALGPDAAAVTDLIQSLSEGGITGGEAQQVVARVGGAKFAGAVAAGDTSFASTVEARLASAAYRDDLIAQTLRNLVDRSDGQRRFTGSVVPPTDQNIPAAERPR